MKKNELRDLSVDFVSLVDFPANQPARMTLRKRQEGDQGSTEGLGILRSLAKRLGLEKFLKDDSAEGNPAGDAGSGQEGHGGIMNGNSGDPGASGTAADIEKAAVAKAAADAKLVADQAAEIVELKKKLQTSEDSSTALLGRVEAIEKAAKEAALTTEVTEITKGLPVKAEDVRKAMVQLDEEGRTVVRDVLAKLRACQRNAGAFAQVGKMADPTRGELTAEDFLRTEVEKVRKADPKLSESQAQTLVYEANPELYDELDPSQSA